MNQEPLPQIHLIRDTDLSVFAYEIHILPEIFLGNANLICVLWRQIPGLIPLPSWGKSHVAFRRLVCLLFYGGSSSNDLNNGVHRSEGFPVSYGSQRGRSLVRRCPDDGFRHATAGYKRNILYPCGVNIERKDGSAATVSLKEWTEMELYEKML